MVIDRVYMSPLDEGAAAAFRTAVDAIDTAIQRVPISAGDILLIDNDRAVHGRDHFRARFDGTDRWLLKSSIARSLEPSSSFRLAENDRIVH